MNASPQIALTSPQNLADIAACITQLPPAALDIATAARTKAVEDRMEQLPAELFTWLATWQAKFPPRVNHPRIILFAADHGISKGAAPAKSQVEKILAGTAAVCAQAEASDADLRLYELDLSTPTADFTQAPAMSEGECTAAIVYGMMAVEMGLDVIALGGVSGGSHLSAAALAKILGHDEVALAWAGTQSTMLPAAKAQHEEALATPLELLRRVGGREIAAMFGVMIAARMGKMPVIIEGPGGLIAATVLYHMDNRAVQHCLYVGGPADDAAIKLAGNLGIMAISSEHNHAEAGMAASSVLPLLSEVVA